MPALASGSKGLALLAAAGAAGNTAGGAASGGALQAPSRTKQQIATARSAARPGDAARQALHEKGLEPADSSCIAPCYGTATRIRPPAGFPSPCGLKLMTEREMSPQRRAA